MAPTRRLFLSHMTVHLDGSCNGLQHYAALGRDEEGAKAVNLVPADRPQDVYSVVLRIVERKVHAFAENADDCDNGAASKYGALARRIIELDLLKRKTVKRPIMTICYGVTSLGAKQQVLNELEDQVGSVVQPSELDSMAALLSRLVLQSVDEIFQRAMQIKKWFDCISGLMNKMDSPTSWLSPIGLACMQPYKKQLDVQVKTARQRVTLTDLNGSSVNKARQRMGFPPNFVHSLDSTHMMLTALACYQNGITFAGVHDSFWAHACDAPQLNIIIRDKFIELHRKPLLEELAEDLRVMFGGLADVPDLPPQGSLNLELVRDSSYIFH